MGLLAKNLLLTCPILFRFFESTLNGLSKQKIKSGVSEFIFENPAVKVEKNPKLGKIS